MQLVYKFDINHSDRLCAICRVTNNLYNQALYIIRNELKDNDRWLFYPDLDRIMKNVTNLEGTINYRLVKSHVAQQTLRVLDKAMKGYVKAVKDWSKNLLFDKIPEGRIVDHINGNKLDNRLCNLRFVSPRENIANSSSKSGSTSKYKGVSFDTSRSKWISSIQINGKTKHLGRFESEEEAAKAYDKASYAEYGVYARLNFPQDVLPKMFVIKQIPAHIESDIIPKMQSLPQSAKDLILKGKGFIDYTSQCLIYNENTGRADSWVPSISDVFADDWEIVV